MGSLLGLLLGGSGGGGGDSGPSGPITTTTTSGGPISFGADNSTLFALLAVALLAVFGIVLAIKK